MLTKEAAEKCSNNLSYHVDQSYLKRDRRVLFHNEDGCNSWVAVSSSQLSTPAYCQEEG